MLVLSPHTDDAELGAGGLILKALKNNVEIFWVVFSTAKESLPPESEEDMLRKEFISVVTSLGIEKYEIHEFPVRNLHNYRQEILEILVKIKKEFSPDIVVGPSLNDYHQDHSVVSKEMIRAFKMDSSIICYDLPWNNIKFENQCFVVLSKEDMDEKVKILQKYKSQRMKNRKYFEDESTWALAISHGMQINENYAEAFEVVRWIL